MSKPILHVNGRVLLNTLLFLLFSAIATFIFRLSQIRRKMKKLKDQGLVRVTHASTKTSAAIAGD